MRIRTELKGKIYLSKVGHVRIFMHRPLEGRIKNLTVKYYAWEWYAAFICDVPDQAKKPVESIPEDRIKGGASVLSGSSCSQRAPSPTTRGS